MRVILIPRGANYQALIVLLQRGLVATLTNPHPFAPTAVMTSRHAEERDEAGLRARHH